MHLGHRIFNVMNVQVGVATGYISRLLCSDRHRQYRMMWNLMLLSMDFYLWLRLFEIQLLVSQCGHGKLRTSYFAQVKYQPIQWISG